MKTLQLSYKSTLLPLQKNELLRSWIVRNAHFLGMKPAQLSTIIFLNADIWKSDIDAQLSENSMLAMTATLNIDKSIIDEILFDSNCINFYPHLNKSKQIKWLLPVGVHNRDKRFSIQYCPLCLKNDDIPFFRSHWRLAFATSCHVHNTKLWDRCPNCFSPIELFRYKKEKNEFIDSLDYLKCSKCYFDLRNAPVKIAHSYEIQCNKSHWDLLKNGHGNVGNHSFMYSHLYFDGLKRLWSFLLCNKKGIKLFKSIAQILAIEPKYIDRRIAVRNQAEPESLDITIRRSGTIITNYLMSDWPNRFVELCNQVGITRNDIFSPYLSYPYWFEQVLNKHLNKYVYCLSKEEVKNIQSLYQNRYGNTITQSHELHKFLKSL